MKAFYLVISLVIISVVVINDPLCGVSLRRRMD
ncbi:MAG: IlvGEDA operon leader peptide [Symbiopectobacterium sp.]